jgi:hypothetical protein
LTVDTTKFLATAIKNKYGLEFRVFLVENAASFQEGKMLLKILNGSAAFYPIKRNPAFFYFNFLFNYSMLC